MAPGAVWCHTFKLKYMKVAEFMTLGIWLHLSWMFLHGRMKHRLELCLVSTPSWRNRLHRWEQRFYTLVGRLTPVLKSFHAAAEQRWWDLDSKPRLQIPVRLVNVRVEDTALWMKNFLICATWLRDDLPCSPDAEGFEDVTRSECSEVESEEPVLVTT